MVREHVEVTSSRFSVIVSGALAVIGRKLLKMLPQLLTMFVRFYS